MPTPNASVTMASLELELAQPEDIESLALVTSRAFHPLEHPALYSRYPNFWTSEGLRVKVERWRRGWDSRRPNCRQLKVTDKSSNKIILQGQWLLPCPENQLEEVLKIPKLTGAYWDSEDERDFAQWLSEEYMVPRNAAFTEAGGRLFCQYHVDVLARMAIDIAGC